MLISSLLQEPIPFGKAISTEIKYDSYENVNSQYILGIFEDFKVFVKFSSLFRDFQNNFTRFVRDFFEMSMRFFGVIHSSGYYQDS